MSGRAGSDSVKNQREPDWRRILGAPDLKRETEMKQVAKCFLQRVLPAVP